MSYVLGFEVENKYNITGNSFINVRCRSFHESGFSTIEPTQKKIFRFTDKIVLYVDEIHEGASRRGPQKFGYIKVGLVWRGEGGYGDSISFEGEYDKPTKTATISVIDEIGLKPKTVNVQVGGN
jgi:hypothetical protein